MANEWMNGLRMKAIEHTYKENDRRPRKQFTNSINDEVMTVEVINQLTAKHSSKVSSERVPLLAKEWKLRN